MPDPFKSDYCSHGVPVYRFCGACDRRDWIIARNVMVAGSIAVVCIAAGLVGYAAGIW